MEKITNFEFELKKFAKVLKSRRTIEIFLQKKIPLDFIKKAIDVAIWAPNHHVTEPWHFYQLGDATKRKCLDLCVEIVTKKKGKEAAEFKRASWAKKPGWLVVTCKKSSNEILQLEDYAACCTAVQNLSLYLWKAGIGSKWISGTIVRDPRFFKIIGINPDKEFVVGLIWYGYPKIIPTQSRKRSREVSTNCP
ncbi:MAG: nitroreductase [Gammaproteobacteria bacterium]|nr:nitroreductase [Gammaproteobacteria bacterium]|tara:strand:- start:394 stop:972 length:579 start_codon:yes stop_codon:yes gene_type:complete